MLNSTVKFEIFFKQLKCCSDLVGHARLVLLPEEIFANNDIISLLGNLFKNSLSIYFDAWW